MKISESNNSSSLYDMFVFQILCTINHVFFCLFFVYFADKYTRNEYN